MKLVVAMDTSSFSERAFEWSLNFLKNRHCPEDRLVVIHSIYLTESSWMDPFHDKLDALWNQEKEQQAQELKKKIAKTFEEAEVDIPLYEWVPLKGDPREKILHYVEESKPSLLVMGKKGLSTMEKVFVGSVSQYCIQNSAVPVMVIH
eukprot:CAMPEP_0201491678 /NCGR_PEP_ID=MMETSP0151_2-20130828/30779_1 /ASSEMBLY_ACC=CAM_ASM_000257 /TAXON_ID=200890 /ORGANISM="Paramoeba atlantica, Strain 621/1 / CCAP 1560/9" /LENGTH=147 /DNA_ID=CAMNT_0047878151 /DNA_START=61 /DNA_END=504 /DNA_ORIENTATION=-